MQNLKFYCKDRRLLFYMSRTLHLFGTDWCAMMVPIQVIRWYRMQCYDGTDSCAIVVPIRRYCQETTVERFIPSFIPLLKERLSEKEYHICLLVKFGFSTSFIATLLEITSSGVSASRKKMLEKLCNRVGTPKDFDEYIRKIQ